MMVAAVAVVAALAIAVAIAARTERLQLGVLPLDSNDAVLVIVLDSSRRRTERLQLRVLPLQRLQLLPRLRRRGGGYLRIESRGFERGVERGAPGYKV